MTIEFPFLVPLEFADASARRLSWKKNFFTASGALCFDRFREVDKLREFCRSIPCALRLTPFRDEFKSKLFATLGQPQSTEAESYGAFLRWNIFDGSVSPELEARTQSVKLTQGFVTTEPTAEEKQLDLTASEKTEFAKTLSQFLATSSYMQVHDTLACFFPEEMTAWKTLLEDFRPRKTDSIPYPALFSKALPLTIERNDENFYFIDHYSSNPKDTQVLFLIFKEDLDAEQDVLWGGFRYCLESKKIKTLPDLPGKFNASQWLKECDEQNPFAFDMLLPARRNFILKHIAPHISKNTTLKGT